MAEIEICTTGEILLQGEVVGQITWLKPFVESDVAGEYDDHGTYHNEWGEAYGCSACDSRDDVIDDLERTILNDLRGRLKACRKAIVENGSPISELDAIDELIEDMDFTP